MKHIFKSVVLLYTSFIIIYSNEIHLESHSWRLTDKWSSCSEKCGPGVERRTPICIRTQYLKSELADESKCQGLPKIEDATRPCNYGDCSDSYRWVVSTYSTCSQACGHDGVIRRSAYCIAMEEEFDEASYVLQKQVDYSRCDLKKRPQIKDSCNQIDCEPEFVYSEWGECLQDKICEEGKQRRKFECIAKLYNGTELTLQKKICSKLKKPVSLWRPCSKNLKTKCKHKTPDIQKDTRTIVQMKRNRVLDLKVGQNAFIIPLTKLTILCPTQYFASQDLKWYHEKHGVVEYNGTSIERIKIDEQGRLIIENFEPIDKGQWICKADNTSASIMLSPRSVADGFLDWLKRTQLMKNEQMPNEDAKTIQNYQEIIQWVEAPWNECPTKCGKVAKQHRLVRCEKVKARSYEVLEDSFCESRGLPKPKASKVCQVFDECPTIVFIPDVPEKCSDDCFLSGHARKMGKTVCKIGERIVDFEMCKDAVVPNIDYCYNDKCKLKWATGEWSKCSKECGDFSFRSRNLLCVWEGSGKPAGSACQTADLTIPDTVQQCNFLPCKWECVDLMSDCDRKKELCRFSMFQFYCCNSCKEHMDSLRNV